MKLYEYEGKKIFKKYHINIPEGYVIKNISEIKEIVFPVLIKAQVLFGGRGKKGLIKQANDNKEIVKISEELFNKKNVQISHLLIENKLNIEKEYYLSIFLDRETKKPAIIASEYGGVDIEKDRKGVFYFEIDPFIGLTPFLLRNITSKLRLENNLVKSFLDVTRKAFQIFTDYKAELVEINPLVLNNNKSFIAADAKIIIDDSVASIWEDLRSFSKNRDLSDFEFKVNQLGAVASEIKGGNIGVITSGAGLLMATVDIIEHSGGKVGAGIDVAEIAFDKDTYRLKKLFDYVKKLKLKVVLISFFLQIGRCDIFAQSIYESFSDIERDKSVIIRLKGNLQEEAKNILRNTKFTISESFQEAVGIAVKKSLERQGK